MKNIFAVLLLFFSSTTLFAQNYDIEMADVMRNDGKIYVVVACVMIILLGLLAYLFILDRRLKNLEKKSLSKK